MGNRRCADKQGLVVEMLKHGGEELHIKLLDLYNAVLDEGRSPLNWHCIVFSMLPKSGDLSQAGNWRPIAILPILYRLFSRMVYTRLLPILDAQQSHDQFGFRPHVRLEEALAIADTMIGKSNEWNSPIWIASLDLKKAFDKIEHRALFAALRRQGVDEASVHLLMELYLDQAGTANGSRQFSINRGVKQGDAISSLLFNAALEEAFIRWKTRLSSEGILLDPSMERLTNIRFADDILLFAKDLNELIVMLELLQQELEYLGLCIHESKTKIMTTDEDNSINFVEIGNMMIQILDYTESHRYLGRQLAVDRARRSEIENHFRIRQAWAKFHTNRKWLCNTLIPIKHRLQLFVAIVEPTILFGLDVLPISKADLKRLGALQRRMLRRIIGWRRSESDTWEETMRQMKERMHRAMQSFYCRPWEELVLRKQWRLAYHIASCDASAWTKLSIRWDPARGDDQDQQQGFRSRGRPRQRWDDHLRAFCRDILQYDSWLLLEHLSGEEHRSLSDAFVVYCLS